LNSPEFSNNSIFYPCRFYNLGDFQELIVPSGVGFLFIFNDCKDAGGRAPTVGSLRDAGAVAEAEK
jgi:hypothetical protein